MSTPVTSTPAAPTRWWRRAGVRRAALLAFLSVTVFGLALAFGAWSRACAGNRCPSIAGLEGYDPDQASKVYAADGRLITDLGTERRTVITLDEMSPAIIAAFLVTEDKRFYDHAGIDWIRCIGAMKSNILTRRRSQGCSSITMQLAGNLFPEDIDRQDRSFGRKIREARVAQEIEDKYRKDKILELYLNQIHLGSRAFGVESASQRYFGKSAREVNVAEAAVLAALPKAPGRYDPRRRPALALQRRNLIIGLLERAGKLTAAEAERWRSYPLLLSSRADFSGVAEYFVEYVRQQLDARFGGQLYRDGLRVYTTLDLDIQQAAERALEAQLQDIESGRLGSYKHQTYADFQESRAESGDDADLVRTPYLQGLAVTIENQTGYIRALVGGRDFADSKFNRATQALRQPGSTFKPLVYSAAIRAGIPLSYVMMDEPIAVPMPGGQPDWQPQNYDLGFDGALTLRQALYKSVNIVAIKLGMEEVGEQAVISEAAKFGITTPIPPVPSIFIGSAEVYPINLIAAYTAFANLGSRAIPIAVTRVEDRQGNILLENKPRLEEVMSPAHAWLMTDGLRDVIRHGTGYGAIGSQGFAVPAGGKTGTTNDGFDVWFVGFTPDLVTGMWLGLDQPQKIMANAQGGRLVAPAWRQMMQEVYDRRTVPQAWTRPSGLTFLEIDRTTGRKATPFCPRQVHVVESFLPGTEPVEFCPVHLPLKIGGSGVPSGGAIVP